MQNKAKLDIFDNKTDFDPKCLGKRVDQRCSILRTADRFFSTFGTFVYRHAAVCLALIIPVIVLTGLPLKDFKIDGTLEKNLKRDDRFLAEYRAFKRQFGESEKIIFGIYGKDVFSRAFLDELLRFHQSLEAWIPFGIKTTSLVSLKIFKSEGRDLQVSSLADEWSVSSERFEDAVARLKVNPMYRDRFFSRDHGFTIVVIDIDACLSKAYQTLEDTAGFEQDLGAPQKTPTEQIMCRLTDKENRQLVQAVRHVTDRADRPEFKIYVTGLPVYTQFIREALNWDLILFIVLSSLIILVFLFYFFRCFQGVFLPFAVVFFSMTTTMGLMVLFDRPIKTPTAILPNLLLIVGLGDSIHILSQYFKFKAKGYSGEQAIGAAMGKAGKALLVTSLTTAAGIASFAGADILPVSDLGIFGALGVMTAFFYTMILLPASLRLLPNSTGINSVLPMRQRLETGLTNLAAFSCRHSGKIVFCGICLILVCSLEIPRLAITHNPLIWLPEQTPIRQATERIDRQIKGMINIEILLTAKNESNLAMLETLEKMEQLHQALDGLVINGIRINKTRSLVDMIKHTHRVLKGDTEDLPGLPRNPEVVLQELMLMEMGARELVAELISTDYRSARFSIYVPWVDAVAYGGLLDGLKAACQKIFRDDYDIVVTGQIPLLTRTLDTTIKSMIRSYLICIFSITAMMILLMVNIRMGLFSMIPNLVPVWMTLGLMGWLNFPLDMYTLLVGSIALGLIVDDTVHFMHYFMHYRKETGSVTRACEKTLQTTGPAIIMTTLLIVSGGSVFMFSHLISLRSFGAAVAGVALLALVCDLFFVPALLKLFVGRRDRD